MCMENMKLIVKSSPPVTEDWPQSEHENYNYNP